MPRVDEALLRILEEESVKFVEVIFGSPKRKDSYKAAYQAGFIRGKEVGEARVFKPFKLSDEEFNAIARAQAIAWKKEKFREPDTLEPNELSRDEILFERIELRRKIKKGEL